jgi:hypothetical protein
MLSRSEIQTVFQFIDADEGRLVNGRHAKASRIRKRGAIPATEWPSGQWTPTVSTPLESSACHNNEPNQQPNRIRGVLQWFTFDAVIRAFGAARARIPIALRMATRH